jgi:hypothetical protein
MNDPYTNQPVAIEGESYTVLALRGWTNQVARRETHVPTEGVSVLAEQMLFEAWDAQGGPQTCVVVAIPSDWKEAREYDAWVRAYDEANRTLGYPEEYEFEQEYTEDGLPVQYSSYRVGPNPDFDTQEQRFWDEVDRLFARITDRTNTSRWRDADGRWATRTTRTSEHAQMMRFARVIDSYTAQADGAPTPIGVTSELHRPTDYDIESYDDMVPWDDDVVGDLGSGPGVPSEQLA